MPFIRRENKLLIAHNKTLTLHLRTDTTMINDLKLLQTNEEQTATKINNCIKSSFIYYEMQSDFSHGIG